MWVGGARMWVGGARMGMDRLGWGWGGTSVTDDSCSGCSYGAHHPSPAVPSSAEPIEMNDSRRDTDKYFQAQFI